MLLTTVLSDGTKQGPHVTSWSINEDNRPTKATNDEWPSKSKKTKDKTVYKTKNAINTGHGTNSTKKSETKYRSTYPDSLTARARGRFEDVRQKKDKKILITKNTYIYKNLNKVHFIKSITYKHIYTGYHTAAEGNITQWLPMELQHTLTTISTLPKRRKVNSYVDFIVYGLSFNITSKETCY